MAKRMKISLVWCLLGASANALAQRVATYPPEQADVMVAAVSRDDSVLAGGIQTGRLKIPGDVDVTLLAWLSPSGEWKSIACDENHPLECRRFEKGYLKKPHTYTMVSADGRGATVRVKRMSLSGECFGYGGQGTYSGAAISYAGVAASSPDMFAVDEPARLLSNQEADPIRKLLSAAVGDRLDSTKELRVYSFRLEGHDLFIVQRAFQDWASKPEYDPHKSGQKSLKMIFAIGTRRGGRFQLLHWKENIEDENERILGTIHLNNGRDFLISTVGHPEGWFFRIYGIRSGKLTVIFSGGGGGC
jgi:hypothetical protein